ncbi:hypothetical protein F5Y14DRAFT_424799 [Nemania sp. NC0429]|nr:hypothetical protein F5Y14DRAFT_424799 [Nemania sp. NC0429]
MSTTVLGKRKSRTKTVDRSTSQKEAEAKLAQLFGAEFGSILSTAKPMPRTEIEEEEEEEKQPASHSDGGSDDDSWDGVSEAEAEESSVPINVVEVVSHTEAYSTTTTTTTALDKRESRAWLSSRPPLPASADDASSSSSKNKKGGGKATLEEDAPSLLKNDLALQRLLAESHLFSSAAARGGGGGVGDATTEHLGRNRHLATDLRLSALGSKTSIYKQAKMPMAFRKGIQAAADGREAKRRREARENGVVLERPATSGNKAAAKGKRKGPARVIDAPSVGRLSGGMLTLSKRDMASLDGGGSRRDVASAKKRRR